MCMTIFIVIKWQDMESVYSIYSTHKYRCMMNLYVYYTELRKSAVTVAESKLIVDKF